MTLAVNPRHRPRTSSLPHSCADHRDYTAGCAGCQAAGRLRYNTIYRAKAYGLHQPALISPIGAARRLQGLAAEGHEARDLAGRLDVTCTLLIRWRNPNVTAITRRRHNDIVQLAESLAGTPGPSRLARTIAHRKGWVPVAAWDDIDDPKAKPRQRDRRHLRDPLPLVERVLAGQASIDLLTDDELVTLWQQWAADPRRHYRDGSTTFARQFDISKSRAAQIAAAAASTSSITERTAA
ncbi:hypothetical protein ACGFIY_21165 [Micromonospora chersina]|uniref:hypothetical protein n=1 Tax=Micromonospora chersina TaxID=47854 RepID=UPI003719FE40